MDDIRQNLAHRGYAVVSKMVPACIRSAVADEALQLVEEVGVRRDLMIEETGFTPRRMRNVTRAQIVERGSVIQQVYESSWMTGMLAEVVGEALYPCPYEPEQFVVTRLERASDTHGWHWDDYGLALVWVAECRQAPGDDNAVIACVPIVIVARQLGRLHQYPYVDRRAVPHHAHPGIIAPAPDKLTRPAGTGRPAGRA